MRIGRRPLFEPGRRWFQIAYLVIAATDELKKIRARGRGQDR